MAKPTADADLFGGLFESTPAPGPGTPVHGTHATLEGLKDTGSDKSLSGRFTRSPIASSPEPTDAGEVDSAPGPGADVVVDGKVRLQDGVEYRTLYLWSRAYDALLKNSAICRDFNTTYRGDLLILRETGLHGSNRGVYDRLATLVDVKDECVGQVRRFIWTFTNIRETHPRNGERQLLVGRVTFDPPLSVNSRTEGSPS